MINNNFEPINIFDFDGTLTTETWPKFWVWVKKFGYSGEKRNDNLEYALSEYRKTHTGNQLETFFEFFNDLLVNNSATISFDELMEGEKYIQYNPGVIEFLKTSLGKNYIVSGGLVEFLQSLTIAKYFSGFYGTPVKLNQEGLISGIGEIMTDDKKILAICDILKRNGHSENDCHNVYYIGDGYSDRDAMRFVHNNGGKAIFVYHEAKNDELAEHNKKIYEALNKDGIIDYCCLADFNPESELSNILQRKMENLSR